VKAIAPCSCIVSRVTFSAAWLGSATWHRRRYAALTVGAKGQVTRDK